jgi:type I restriction enzyme S subunit
MMAEQKQVIPEGYQQTEVGIIPDDWVSIPLNDVCKVIGDGIHATPVYSLTGNYFFINGNNISNGRVTVESDTKKVDFNEYCKHKIDLTSRSLLLSINGTIGNLAFYNHEKIVLGKSAAYLTIKDAYVSEYIYYSLQTTATEKSFTDGLTGSTIKNLGLGTIRSTCVGIPENIKEQTAIANALSDVDALISELEKLIAKKQAIKTATMQQLLTGKTRLPEFALREDGTPKGYKASELGEIPEDWEVVEFGDLLDDFRNGYAFSAQGYCASGIPIITMAQIGLSGAFQFDEEKVNRWDEHQFNKLKDFWVRNGDLLIAMTDVTPDKNLIGQMTIAKLSCIALLNQRVGLLRMNPQKGDIKFFSYMSCLSIWKSYCKSVASLGVQANIGTSDIRKALVPLPEKEEQTSIAAILSDMDEEIQILQQRLNKTRQIKQGMMQELLTGKTRLI